MLTFSVVFAAMGRPRLSCWRLTGRLAYPSRLRLYWIQDNLSCHWTPAIRAWAAANNVELVPTPTYASFLNRIESHFGAIDEFVCKNADYLDWDSYALAMAKHIRHRNTPQERAQRRLDAAKRRQRRTARQTLKLAA
ncbi:MAG TPA: hypothetical protein VIL98_11735 [Gaiellaceae bacterium]